MVFELGSVIAATLDCRYWPGSQIVAHLTGFSVLDRSVGFQEGATYQTLRAMQLCRYFDTQVFFKDEAGKGSKTSQKYKVSKRNRHKEFVSSQLPWQCCETRS